MKKGRSILLLLLLLVTVSVTTRLAVARPPESCLPPGESPDSIFSIWGDSEHWALILQGLGTCQDGKLITAKAIPYLVWTGGGQAPERAEVSFAIQNLTCIQGAVGVGPSKVVRIADCKLIYPGQDLLPPQQVSELVRVITTKGRFEVTWEGRTEQITWRYAYPIPSEEEKR